MLASRIRQRLNFNASMRTNGVRRQHRFLYREGLRTDPAARKGAAGSLYGFLQAYSMAGLKCVPNFGVQVRENGGKIRHGIELPTERWKIIPSWLVVLLDRKSTRLNSSH